MHKKALGQLGENYAANFLQANGYTIFCQNYYARYGEIDLITIDPDHTLVFIEVKTRRTATFGQPQESITNSKKHKLLKTIYHFLQNKPPHLPFRWRLDLICVKLSPTTVTYFKNILDG